MKESLIIIQSGDYSNDDAYERVLTYVSKKNYVGGYGMQLPPNRENAIKAFYWAEQNSNYENSRYIWHFAISLPKKTDNYEFLQFGDKIAMLFAYNYQVLYSLDLEKTHPHIHFAVNAYSYHPDHPLLSEDIFDEYMAVCLNMLQHTYPDYKARITEGRIRLDV